MHRFGHRATVMAGGLLACIGLVISSFATDVNFLIGSFGIFTGKLAQKTDLSPGKLGF